MDSYENEASKFAAQRTKLKNICEAHDLTYTFIKNSYPIKLIIRPIKGVGEQMSMLETASEDSYISPDAYLLFTMKDGVLVYRMSKTFTIEDALFGKIKNIFKNMHSYYCQFFFRELIESGRLKAIGGKMPEIPETTAKEPEEKAPDLPPDAEKLEEIEDDTDDADDAEAEAPAEDELAKATEIARQNDGITQALLEQQMGVTAEKAIALLDELETAGVIDFYDGRYYLAKADSEEEYSMAKAAVTRRIRDDHQKNFLKIFNGLTGKHSRWEIWEDFVTLTAIEISNSTDKVNATERTKMYQTIISKYSAKERDGMAEMLAEVVMGMEQNPDQDFLGSLYMMCELGNDHAGQFFTPYDVCRCMAEITFDPKLHPDMEGFISVSDPACGAGATLLAFLNVCKRRNICYHNKVLVIAQDIDFIVGLMCYIQCSFMGCAGYVVIGDTLVNPATAYDSRGLLPAGPQNRIWYMPLFSTDVWYMRRQIAQMNLLFEPKGEPAKIEKTDIKPANLQKSIKNEPKAPENEPLNETKTGQLTFF